MASAAVGRPRAIGQAFAKPPEGMLAKPGGALKKLIELTIIKWCSKIGCSFNKGTDHDESTAAIGASGARVQSEAG